MLTISTFFFDSSASPAGFLLDDAHDFLFFRWFVRCIQKQVIRQLSEAATENRGLNHDIKHHLRAIDRMASEHGQTEICDFLFQVEEQIAASLAYSHVAFCKNPVVNALIEYFYGIAQTQGTELQVRIDLPDPMPLTDVELCTVLGNLLDNAVEACIRQTKGKRRRSCNRTLLSPKDP